MQTVRIWFEKSGDARYISHLDLSRCMARALRRAKVPAWYTEGFNPHLFVTFALPLSLGQEGEREAMDLRLPKEYPIEQAAQALSKTLPPGLAVLGISLPQQKPGEITHARYRIICSDAATQSAVETLLMQETLPVIKKTKKGERELDLKTWFAEAVQQTTQTGLTLTVMLPAGSADTVNPSLFADLVYQALPTAQIRIVREGMFCQIEGEWKEFC